MLRPPTLPHAKAARLGGARGTALTEFVIVVPLFILLIFWSEFFADFGILTLKADEAARYALWELTAPQNASLGGEQAALNQDLQTRFSSLNSPQVYDNIKPTTRSFQKVAVSVQTINWTSAPVSGTLPPFNNPLPSGSGLVGVFDSILDGVAGIVYSFFNTTSEFVVQKFGFNTTRDAQVTVQFAAQNTLFPGGSLLGIFFDATSNMQHPVANVVVQRSSPVMLVDTWKAWPGPYGQTAVAPTTPVNQTYSATGSNAVETELSARLTTVFSFAAPVTSVIDTVIQFFGISPPFSTNTWLAGTAGPVVALTGAPADAPDSPATGTPTQRLGNSPCVYSDMQTYAMPISPSSPQIGNAAPTLQYQPCSGATGNAGVDRSRFTVPSQINSLFWTNIGGLDTNAGTNSAQTAATQPAVVNVPSLNPYYPTLYDCRDIYYMGSRIAENQKWNNSSYYQQGFSTCGTETGF